MTDYQTIAECYLLADEVKKQWMKQALKDARDTVKKLTMKTTERTRELDIEDS